MITMEAKLQDLIRRASADCYDDDGIVFPGAHLALVTDSKTYRWWHSRITPGGRQLRLGYNAFGHGHPEFLHIECVYTTEAYDGKLDALVHHRVFTCTCSNEMPWTAIESILWDAVGWLDSDGVRFGR